MAQAAADHHSPPSAPKRPKGILKNSSSFYRSPDVAGQVSPTSTVAPGEGSSEAGQRPGLPHRELSEKEITQMNTEINAGEAAQRRNSSNPRGSLGRRQSSQSSMGGQNGDGSDENATRLKWDEANLYLNEGQMGGKMKIDEPKTPFAKNYDPTEDEEEIETINAQEIAVDELDMNRSKKPRSGSGAGARTSDIPGLDLGEPELDPMTRRDSDGERRVHVNSDQMDVDGGHHGEEAGADMSSEEREKHKKFEEMRKKHYEMKNIKDLLGHPDKVDAMDEDDEA